LKRDRPTRGRSRFKPDVSPSASRRRHQRRARRGRRGPQPPWGALPHPTRVRTTESRDLHLPGDVRR